jgi:hypothetical protein
MLKHVLSRRMKRFTFAVFMLGMGFFAAPQSALATCQNTSGQSCDATYSCSLCLAGYTCCGTGLTCLLDTYSNCWTSTGDACTMSGQCVTDSCVGNVCAQVGVGGQCGADADCTTGDCYQNAHTCVEPPGMACSSGSQCGSSTCTSSVCVCSGASGACARNQDCKNVNGVDCTAGYGVCNHAGPGSGDGYGYCWTSCLTGNECG